MQVTQIRLQNLCPYNRFGFRLLLRVYINFRILCPYNRSGICLLLRAIYQFPDSIPVKSVTHCSIVLCILGQNNFHYVPYAILIISSIPASSMETSLIFFCFERSAMISAAVVSFFINLYLAILSVCSTSSQRSCSGASSS